MRLIYKCLERSNPDDGQLCAAHFVVCRSDVSIADTLKQWCYLCYKRGINQDGICTLPRRIWVHQTGHHGPRLLSRSGLRPEQL